MLKEKRVEFHSGICYLSAFIFIAVALLCMLGNYAVVDTVSAQTGEHNTMYFTGYNLLEYVSEKANANTYDIDYYTVAGTCNFLLLICMGIMTFSMLVGILSSRKEAFKKSLIATQVFYIVCLILSILSPLQLMSKIIDNYGDNIITLSYSFGFLPWVMVGVCLITFIIFSLFFKDGYGRKPNQKQRFSPAMFSKSSKKGVEVTETAVIIEPPVADVLVDEKLDDAPIAEVISDEKLDDAPVEEVKTEEVAE